jgi:hypothetical protein
VINQEMEFEIQFGRDGDNPEAPDMDVELVQAASSPPATRSSRQAWRS